MTEQTHQTGGDPIMDEEGITPQADGASPPPAELIEDAYQSLDRVSERLETIEMTLEDLLEAGGPDVEGEIRKLRRQIRDFEPSITMIGQVKAGKTSLVNAMVGRPDLLPADINPWTSVVTSLHMEPGGRTGGRAKFRFFSEEEWQHLVSRGGRIGELAERAGAEGELDKVRQQLEIMREKSRQRLGKKFELLLGQEHEYGYVDEELIERYVCLGDDFEADTEADQSRGRFADITKSADLYLAQGALPMRMCIRDTPGVNDTFMIREQITVNAIRQSRLCVVVLSAHQALSTVDMALIRLISNVRSRDVLIFVNRIDELSNPAEEIPEIESSIRATLKAQGGPEDAQIIFGSAFWASRALRGEYQSLGRASAEALLNLAEKAISDGLSETKVEDMVWRLSGMPVLCRAIADRVLAGEAAELEDRVLRSARNIAGRLSAEQATLARRMAGADVAPVNREDVGREMAAIAERAQTALSTRLTDALKALDDRLEGSRKTFLGRATSSLVKHLESYGENEVWTYDPAGLRVLLRSGYQAFATKGAKAATEVFEQTAYEIRTLYLGAFQPPDGTYDLAPPPVPRAAPPVALGQTIALDIRGGWWSRWWRKRRSYQAYAEEFAGLIDAEVTPILETLVKDHAEPYRTQLDRTLADFIAEQRDSLMAMANRTDEDLDALRAEHAEDAEARAERLNAALEALNRFGPMEERRAAE
ncbi:hypothetical protein HKCCE3408_10650 [Rhodobacterales bacterium HKCCE3408]|nr:hypothetical protein [Rhodobacterales bacterium HKCCE3408]